MCRPREDVVRGQPGGGDARGHLQGRGREAALDRHAVHGAGATAQHQGHAPHPPHGRLARQELPAQCLRHPRPRQLLRRGTPHFTPPPTPLLLVYIPVESATLVGGFFSRNHFVLELPLSNMHIEVCQIHGERGLQCSNVKK